MHRFTTIAFTTYFALSCFLLALFSSWQLLAKIDFAYPQAYALIDIGENIDYYGPRNRFRAHFEQTDIVERYRVFTAINEAVHNHGAGLEHIYYHQPNGTVLGKLLHKAEIVHLQDVANLIDVLVVVGMASLVSFIGCCLLAKFTTVSIAGVGKQLLSLLAILLVATVIVVVIGAEKVFYALHILVFPDNHQWYFFYEDSLMSTLMKAPDLFAVIAAQIVLLATVIFALLVYVAKVGFCSKSWFSSQIKTLD